MPTDKQISERVKGLIKQRPSAIGNSILMGIIQFTSYILGWTGILSSIYFFTTANNVDRNTEDFYINQFGGITALVTGVVLLLVWRLTKMVRYRNAFILNVEWALEEDEEKPE